MQKTRSYPAINRRKNRAWRLLDRGLSVEEVAARLEVHPATAYRYAAEWRRQREMAAQT